MPTRISPDDSTPNSAKPTGAHGAGLPRKGTTCADVLKRALVDGDLRGMNGLPRGCTLTDVENVLGASVGGGFGRLSGRGTPFKRYTVSGQTEVVRVFFGPPDAVILADVPRPHIAGSVDALLEELGEPEEILPARKSIFDYNTAERVYARRGLTLNVGAPFDRPDEGRIVLHLFLYAPTTPADWIDRLGAIPIT